MSQREERTSPLGCAVAIAAAIGVVALEQFIEHRYESSPLTALRGDAKEDLTAKVLFNPAAYVDQEVTLRGELHFQRSEKPSHFFSTPHGLNYHSKSEDGKLFYSYYRLHNAEGVDSFGVRIDEYQEGGIFSSAKPTDFSGKYDLVGTIKNIDGQYLLVVDHVPPTKIP